MTKHDPALTTAPVAQPRATREPGDELPRGATVGRYVVLEPIGRGGMGVVYAAYDYGLDRRIALKLVANPRPHEGDHVRLMREAQAMAKLSHPGIVAVHDIGVSGDQVFIAMELVDGTTLRRWLAEKPRTWHEIAAVFLQAGRGLAAAHRVGLVHRDFKPDNVLVDRAGHARVGDFGLAYTSDADVDRGERHAQSPFEANITRTGAAIGTPAYMSPEQHAGEPTDARSDQFSFCVALYEALYGHLPHPDATPEAIVGHALHGGAMRKPPRRADVPAEAERALARGLSHLPAERWESMDALLAALEPKRPAARRRWALPLGAAGVTAGLLVFGGLWFGARDDGSDPPCSGAESRLAGAWDADRRAKIEARFASNAGSSAEQAWRTVSSQLDAHARAWTKMHEAACRQTARGEQSAELLDLRMACLDRRRNELGAIVDRLLDTPDPAKVAVVAVKSIDSIEGCANVEELRSTVPPPKGETAARVADLLKETTQIHSLVVVGRFDEALERIRSVVKATDALGYAPLRAEVYYRLAEIESSRALDPGAAERALYQAIAAAEAGHVAHLRAAAWVDLIWVVSELQHDHEQAVRLGNIAAAVIAGAGRDPAHEAALDDHVGTALLELGRPEQALGRIERAVQLAEKIYGPDDPSVALLQQRLGQVLQELGRDDEAVTMFRRALAIFERERGPLHPDTLAILDRLGGALIRTDGTEALEIFRLGLGRAEQAAAGSDTLTVADLAASLGRALWWSGDNAGARAHYERARRILDKLAGTNHPATAALLTNMGQLDFQEGDFATAADEFERALAIHERVYGPDHPRLVDPLIGNALAELSLGHIPRGVQLLERAVGICTTTCTPEQLSVARRALAEAQKAQARERKREPAREVRRERAR